MLPSPHLMFDPYWHNLHGVITEYTTHSEMLVMKSPLVRTWTPMFQKVVSEIGSRCVTVLFKTEKETDQMDGGRLQTVRLVAHAQCPGDSQHFCSTDPHLIERVFTF